jgi:hypothetical protein
VKPLIALLALFLIAGQAWAADKLPINIGVNVGGVNDYAVESFFVDAMKQSRHWGSPQTPWDEAAQVDAQGWPTQDAGVVVLCCVADAQGNTELTGSYSLTFKGIANVNFVAYAGTVTNLQYNAATNTSTATVSLADSGSGTSLILAFTNTQRSQSAPVGSGVTDVTVIRPATAPNGQAWWTTPGQVFTTPFLALLQPFSTLRFMDFAATNDNMVKTWRQRTTQKSATQQSASGAAWEYAVLLANTLHKDIWINIPAEADDNYVNQLATLMHNTLDPSLHIYTEYSNEVWNFSFQQFFYNLDKAEQEVKADRQSPLALRCHDRANCRYQWAARRVGLRALQIGQQFNAIFGAGNSVVRPVYATQLGQTYYVSLVMDMITHYFGEPATYLYALAQAPYWAGDNSLDGLTAHQELVNAAANLATLPVPQRAFAAWSTNYGLRSITYEGGPGMSGTASLNAKIAANTAPAMGKLVEKSLRSAAANGESLYMYYNDSGTYGQYGMWGLTQDVFDLTTPKYLGVQAALARGSEKLATGAALPATIPAGYPDFCAGNQYIVQGNSYAYLSPGGSCSYLVNAAHAGNYTATLSVGTYYGATTALLRDNRRLVAQIAVPDTGGNVLNWTSTQPVTIHLSAGLHVLTVGARPGAFGMQNFTVAPSN